MSTLKERLLLDESRLNGRKLRPGVRMPLLEVDKGLTRIEAAKRDPNIPIYMVGILSSGDKVNRNGRLYPWPILKKECERYFEHMVKTGMAHGELDHPEDSATPMLKNASHKIEDIWYKGKDVWGKIKLYNAYMPPTAPGLMARGILLNDGVIGISSRALGSLDESVSYDCDVVAEDLEIACWDLVSFASNHGSEKWELSESKKRQPKKALLTESQCFGGMCGIKNPLNESQQSSLMLTEAEQTYINILGVEKFLQVYYNKK